MSQHDYDLANQAGAAFRADLNNALLAAASQNSGATAPSPSFTYMFWPDTTTGIFKQRNSANTAWISLFTIATGAWLAVPTKTQGDNSTSPSSTAYVDAAKAAAISTASSDATTKANAAQAAAISTASSDATTKANAAQAAAIAATGLSGYTENTVALLAGGVRTVAHSLGVKPKLITLSARCVTAENGYSIGDELDGDWFYSSNHQITFARDATNVYVHHQGSTFVVMNKTTGVPVASTIANWNWVIRTWK